MLAEYSRSSRTIETKLHPQVIKEIQRAERSSTQSQETQFQSFIDFISGFMPQSEEESHMFVQGAKYAKDLLDQFGAGNITNISNETIAEFLTLANHTARQKDKQRNENNRNFDLTDILAKKDGKEFIQDIVDFSSEKNSDLAAHFNGNFENTYTKLGAFTLLTLTEMENSRNNSKPMVQLQPDLEFSLLESA